MANHCNEMIICFTFADIGALIFSINKINFVLVVDDNTMYCILLYCILYYQMDIWER